MIIENASQELDIYNAIRYRTVQDGREMCDELVEGLVNPSTGFSSLVFVEALTQQMHDDARKA